MEITIQNQAIKAVIKTKGAELSSLQKDGDPPSIIKLAGF